MGRSIRCRLMLYGQAGVVDGQRQPAKRRKIHHMYSSAHVAESQTPANIHEHGYVLLI